MQQQINGLAAGIYFVKLASDKTVGQKAIVQQPIKFEMM